MRALYSNAGMRAARDAAFNPPSKRQVRNFSPLAARSWQ
jgi:hypothetical protein